MLHDYILNFVFLFWVLFPACLTKVDRTDILAFFPSELSGNVFSLSPLSVRRNRDFFQRFPLWEKLPLIFQLPRDFLFCF